MSADSTSLPQEPIPEGYDRDEITAALRDPNSELNRFQRIHSEIMRRRNGMNAIIPPDDAITIYMTLQAMKQANDDALKRGMLVCPTCNDHHDEESVCRACADLEVTLARHREVTGMALARLRSALLKRGVNVTLDHAQSILDYAINGDGVG